MRNERCCRTIEWPRGLGFVGHSLMLLVVGGIVFASVSQAAMQDAPTGVPKAEIESYVHDFGDVWVGPPLAAKFVIRNTGTAPLDILNVKPQCGCTQPGPHPKQIAPGDKGEFNFTVDSTKVHNNWEKNVVILTNDPAKPDLKLILKGQVRRYVEVTPNAINYNRIMGKDAVTRSATITNNTDEPLTLEISTLPDGLQGKFDVTLKEIVPGKKFQLDATAVPPFSTGTMNGIVELTTNNPKEPSVKVRLAGYVPARIDVQPPTLPLSKNPGELTRYLDVSNNGSTPVTIKSARIDNDQIKVSVTERTPGKTYQVAVAIPANYEVPTSGCTIELETDDPEVPIVKVPVMQLPSREQRAAQHDHNHRPAAPPSPNSLLGSPAPAFSATTVDGKPVNADTMKQEVTVLNFFAPNCPYCKKQMPKLENLRKAYAEKGVRFVNVQQTMRAPYTDDMIKELMKILGTDSMELVTDHKNEIGPKYNASTYPTAVVVGKSGNVEAVHVGDLPTLETTMSQQLDRLLSGQPAMDPSALAAARGAARQPQQQGRPTTPPAQQQAQKRPAEMLIGKPAPAFSASTVDGAVVTNDSLKEKPTVMFFFAINCPHCKKAMPIVEEVVNSFDGKVRFLNVAETMKTAFPLENIQATVTPLAPKSELIHDPNNDLGRIFAAQGFPTMLVMGTNGNVESVHIGNKATLATELRGELQRLLEGKPALDPAARAAAPTPSAPPAGPRGGERMIGKFVPADFAAATLDGNPVSADTLKGQVSVLNFFAVNCPHCKNAMPKLELVRRDYEAKGVRFVNICQSMKQQYPSEEVVNILKQTGAELEVVHDPDNKLGPKLMVQGFPHLYVVGKDLKVESCTIGNTGDLEKKLRADLDRLLAQ